MLRNPGFSVTESVVGGNLLVTPMASLELTGSDDNRDMIWDFGPSLGNTYYIQELVIAMPELDAKWSILYRGPPQV